MNCKTDLCKPQPQINKSTQGCVLTLYYSAVTLQDKLMCNIKSLKIPNWNSYCVDISINTVQGARTKKIFGFRYVLLRERQLQTTLNTEPSSEHTSNYHNGRLTVGEGADSSRWDSSVDAPEAPCLVEALLTLQSCLNSVQGEEGQIHTHPCTASCLERQRSLCGMQSTLYNTWSGKHLVSTNYRGKHLALNAPLRSPARC